VPEFEERFPIARAMRRYARGVARAATGAVEAARAEQRAFEAEAAGVPEGAQIGINPASPVLEIARHVLAGEVLYREARYDAAFAELRTAAGLEDDLRYDEPSPWMMPVRHALGALLLEQGRVAEAEQAYREDLDEHPENGWALQGLAECLRRRGEAGEAAAVEARFSKAWASADTALDHGSCFCRGPVAAGADCPEATTPAGPGR